MASNYEKPSTTGLNDTVAADSPAATRQPHFGYKLFVYREELSHRKVNLMRLSKKKLVLTKQLLNNSMNNLDDEEEEKTVKTELKFKKKLKLQLQRLRRMRYAKSPPLPPARQRAPSKEGNRSNLVQRLRNMTLP